jgi:predicted transcriptional regulator
VNPSELAMKMLEWERLRRELDEIETEIKEAVLGLGKTQVVGNVRATYSGGRRTYDYKTPVLSAGVSDDRLAEYQKVVTDWRKACQDFDLEPLVENKSDPSVSIKLEDK